MKIVVFGTGYVGGVLVSELAGRGHEVIAVSRSGKADLPAQVAAVTGSVHDPEFLSSVTAGADAIVAALPALSPEGSLGAAVSALLQAAQESGARLGVVGGAAIIPTVLGGPRQADTPDFPARFAPVVDAHQQALDILNSAPENVDWFYLIPAGEFGAYNPGTRTGSYRTSSIAQVTNEEGRSLLGVADYAIAFADELENPRTHRTWLAIGY
ncbi:NAD(P)H-binding protein [Micromonospora soli]|uniref:NAD(P)-dependent oxidoreductase n=1 Tax=Micromonospora sp. NBRC 110009 TaxID=3061627 RepID=UPI002672EF2C|nr:NAD(P)H-binding protein [Micromonospora sp. NBRC 110009]WKT98508.1 NAD(P)H-binding protein [Micromonospora sp. NBRC 110009]